MKEPFQFLFGKLRAKGVKPLLMMRGGSHLYGLNGPGSDEDFRGVFKVRLNESLGVGSPVVDTICSTSEGEGLDFQFFSGPHFLRQLIKSTGTSLEILFGSIGAELNKKGALFDWMRDDADKIVCPRRLLNTTKGYFESEKRLALGERTGKLGGKRKATLDKYGFSPKNVVQLLRLSECAASYIRDKFYPVNFREYHDKALYERMTEIKFSPENFTMEQIMKIINESEKKLHAIEEPPIKEPNLAVVRTWLKHFVSP
jgi:hypothetical protein